MRKKKFLSVLLCTVAICSASTSVFAKDLANSVGSSSTDITVGKDTTQDKTTIYGSGVTVEGTTYSSSSAVSVYATKKSEIQYSLPQVVIGDATKGSASCVVGVKGDVSVKQNISITAPKTFTLTDGKRTITANLTQAKTNWIWSDLSTSAFSNSVCSMTFTIPAGEFTGSFNFTIAVTTA